MPPPSLLGYAQPAPATPPRLTVSSLLPSPSKYELYASSLNPPAPPQRALPQHDPPASSPSLLLQPLAPLLSLPSPLPALNTLKINAITAATLLDDTHSTNHTQTVLQLYTSVERLIEATVAERIYEIQSECTKWEELYTTAVASQRDSVARETKLSAQLSKSKAEGDGRPEYTGEFITLHQKQASIVEDDAMLIQLGIEPHPTTGCDRQLALTSTTYRPSMQALDTVRGERDLMTAELDATRMQLHLCDAARAARECEVGKLKEEKLYSDAARESVTKEKDELKRKCKALHDKVVKQTATIRTHENTVHEAKELAEMAIEKGNEAITRAQRIKAAKMKPLIRARRAATKVRDGCEKIKEGVAREIRMCLDDVCYLVRDGLYRLGGELEGAQQMRVNYVREASKRRKAHDEMVQVLGRVRVMVRIRPVAPNQPACCRVDRGGQKPGDLISVEGGEEFVYQHTRRKFRFDKVFTSTPSNDGFQGIQKAVLPLAMSAMDGYNVCIFAYGQTGSGKTLTMDSVTAAVCNKMFNARDGFIATVSVSYVEVYNNEVRDLLRNPKRDGRSGEDGWNSHSGSTVKIPSVDVRTTEAGTVEVDCFEVMVGCGEDVTELVRRGTAMRSTFATDLNEHSSRSHALLTINCEVKNEWAGLKYSGKLHLVDLAGSERLGRSHVVGERLKETQYINSSLAALGNVMSSLVRDQLYIPYRDSKLTMLLSDSLGGGSKVLMMLCVKDGDADKSESLQTLQFGARGKKIRMAGAIKHVEEVEEEKEGGEEEEEEEAPSKKIESANKKEEKAALPVPQENPGAGPPSIRGRGKKK